MLSSLAQQTRRDLVRVCIAHMPPNGSPSTDRVIEFFSPTVAIEPLIFTDYGRFQMRGFVRTDQLRSCSSEWILFSDADMVYHPEYFERLALELEKHPAATNIITSGRKTTEKKAAIDLVDGHVSDARVLIADAFAKADAITLPNIKRARALGNSQIVNVKHGAHGGFYSPEGRKSDRGWGGRGQNTKSDFRFRNRISSAGGSFFPLNKWFRESVIHLNHDRDLEVHEHLEIQR